MLVDSRKYYFWGIGIPALIVILVQLGVLFTRENQTSPGDQSEYFTENSMDVLTFFLVIVNAVLTLLLSSPIILFEVASKNNIIRFLIWFLLPGTWLVYLVYRGIESWLNYPGHGDSATFLWFNSLPYLVGLVWAYIKFTRQVEITKGELPDLEIITKEDRKINQPHTPPPQSPMGG